jgi:hypothetical protein
LLEPGTTRCLAAVALSIVVEIWSWGHGLLVVHPKNAHARFRLCVGQVHPGRSVLHGARSDGSQLAGGWASYVEQAGLALIPRGLGGSSCGSLGSSVTQYGRAIGW